MNLVMNGKPETAPDGVNVTELLRLRNVATPEMVSVELNGEILERGAFETTVIRDGDQLEFLYFMGGGAR